MLLSRLVEYGTNGKQEQVRLSGKSYPEGIVQEIKIWPCWQMVYASFYITRK